MFSLIIETTFMAILLSYSIRTLLVMFKLVDNLTDRKNHIGQIPLIGGICIFIEILAS
jgi:UDP-N-acetylmuramyl pentapeptide phosphotransferase/UDP-N-acetylglucosamine-1-phosphate transferase